MTTTPSSDPQAADPIERATADRAERERVVRGIANAMQGAAYGTATLNKAERTYEYLVTAGLLVSAPAPADDEAAIERMAQAMWQSETWNPDTHLLGDWRLAARAALAALREG